MSVSPFVVVPWVLVVPCVLVVGRVVVVGGSIVSVVSFVSVSIVTGAVVEEIELKAPAAPSSSSVAASATIAPAVSATRRRAPSAIQSQIGDSLDQTIVRVYRRGRGTSRSPHSRQYSCMGSYGALQRGQARSPPC